jgi:hypothetical protein
MMVRVMIRRIPQEDPQQLFQMDLVLTHVPDTGDMLNLEQVDVKGKVYMSNKAQVVGRVHMLRARETIGMPYNTTSEQAVQLWVTFLQEVPDKLETRQ